MLGLRLQSIGARLVFFALVCAVPVIAFMLIELRQDVTEVRRSALESADVALVRLQARIAQQLTAAEAAGQLAGLAGGIDVRAGAHCDNAMRRARDAAPFARNFFLADASLRIRCSSSPMTKNLPLDDHAAVREAMRSGRPVIGDSDSGILDARSALTLAVPIADENNQVWGVALTVFDSPSFTAGIGSGHRLVVGLVDRNGTLVSRSIDSARIEVGNHAVPQDELRQLRAAGGRSVQLAWLDERERLYLGREITYRGQPLFWGAAGVDAHALQAQAYTQLAGKAALVLLVTAAVALLAVVATRPLVLGRMRALLAASAEVSQGRYGSRVRVDLSDEVAVVEKAFNQMLDAVEAEHRTLERRVEERTRELAIANANLESFSSTVSHDLRAPVAVVRTFSQLLLDKGLLDGKDLHYLSRIKAAGDNMNELIAALLDLARFARVQLEPVEVDLSQLAREAAHECRDATGREIEVRVQAGGRAMGDPGLLRVAMSNLLANAWKFTRGAARPMVEIGFERAADGACTVTVRDNGAGFDEAHASRLFQPFQRLHTSREFPGLGIGLATVHRIVQRHGGRIWASGRVGEGAAFHFILPPIPK